MRQESGSDAQGRLSGAVRADEADARVEADVDVDALEEDAVLVVPEVDVGELEQRRRDLVRLGEFERDDVVLLGRRQLGQLLEDLDLALRLCRTVGVVCGRARKARWREEREREGQLERQRRGLSARSTKARKRGVHLHRSMKACRCWRYWSWLSYSRRCCLARSLLVA